MVEYKYITVALNTEKDSDLIQALKNYDGNRNDLIKQLLREYFFGPQNSSGEDVSKALLRVIQLEKEFKELLTAFNQFKKSIYKEIDEKIDGFLKSVEKFQKELELLKEGYKRFEEKAKEKEAEEERKKREEFIQELKKEFIARAKPYLKAFRSGDGSYTLLTYQIKQLVKEYEEKGLSRDWLWRICFEEAPNLRRWVENEIRRKYV